MLRETTVENGRVAGIPAADPRITAYKGIPFAAPPVGALRWRPPQPAENWEGVYQADRFAPISMQETPGLGDPEMLYNKEWHVDSEIPMSEDCLYLNVWTPAKTANEKLPVMVWIFGGGLQVGYPSEMEFDGERIARRGVVLVSVNYRLNVFGLLAHPEITAENPENPCNFSLLDQRAAMVWVQKNIAAFGGDAGNVTIFGQSAGAGSVMAHLCSPMSKGLFHKAIPQSGGGIAPGFNQGNPSLEKAEKTGVEFFEFLGVSSLEEARKIDGKTLIRKQAEFPPPPDNRFKWGMVIDGRFLPRQPAQVILAGERHDVPVMTGSTVDEFPMKPLKSSLELFPAGGADKGGLEESFKAFSKERFGDKAEEFMKLCGYGETDIETVIRNGTYNFFELGNWIWCDKNSRLGQKPIYLYRFNPPMPGDDAGSFHSSELWFTFETLAKCWRPFKGFHYDLARQMCNYWTNFAKTGDPNGKDADGTDMPQWNEYSIDEPWAMYFGKEAGMDKNPPAPVMDFIIKYDCEQV